MGVDLRLEPYAELFEKEQPALRIIDEFCFPDVDNLLGRLGLRWDDYSVFAVNDRLPHDVALKLLDAVEGHQAPPPKLLTFLRHYRFWYENPEFIPPRYSNRSIRAVWLARLATGHPTNAVLTWCCSREKRQAQGLI
jgi:hypothetical protein